MLPAEPDCGEMDKSEDAFRTISEAAEELDLPQHVLRFWETRFPQIRPLKRGGGRRYYRPDDVELLRAIRHLLYSEGYTIKGVQRMLKERGVRAVLAMRHEAGETAGRPRLAAPVAQDSDAMIASVADREDAGRASGEVQEWGIAPDLSQGPGPIRTDAAPPRASAPPALSPESRRKLQAVVAELAECRRILGAAVI